MEEIFLIASHTPNIEQQQLLRNLIFKLKNNNQKVLIISHTHVPEDIIKLADYYFYDSENPLLEVWKHTEGWNYFTNDIFKIDTQFSISRWENYGLAACRLLWFGLSICKSLGYQKVHWLEYDTDFNDLEEFKKVSNYLDEYDNVSFKLNDFNEFPLISGQWIGFNLNKYDYNDLNFDYTNLLKVFKEGTTAGMSEILIYKELISKKNKLLLLESDIDTNNLFLNLSTNLSYHSGYHKNFYLIPCVIKDTNDVILFGNNKTNQDITFEIILNDTFISFKIKPGHWRYINLCPLDKLIKLKFYIDNKFLRELDFENDIPKEEFRLKSIFTKH
jgi:hypothetical protein